MNTKCFGAYDIRGAYPEEVSEELAYRVGRCFPKLFDAKNVAVGHDVRLSGPSLQRALMQGLSESGCDVTDIGQCGTEMIYFATAHYKLDGGIMVTASHNPREYNGMKLVQRDARPISGESGLRELEWMVREKAFPEISGSIGKVTALDIAEEYVKHILSYVDISKMKPFKIVVDAGNGAAGTVLNVMEKALPFDMVKIRCEPNGNFPDGVPNPLLPGNRERTANAVIVAGADAGIAWDGDFDRCFLFEYYDDMEPPNMMQRASQSDGESHLIF